MRMASYLRVSTEDQSRDGYGMDAQRAAIEAECARRGWILEEEVVDVASGATTVKREGLTRLLERLERKELDGLVVARLDRLTRSVGGFADIANRAEAQKWSLVCIDPGVDMTTPSGRAMAGMCSVFAQFERELISERTRAGMAAAKARGVHCGRSESTDPEVIEEIMAMHRAGLTSRKIAALLTESGLRTSTGMSVWSHKTIIGIVNRRRVPATP